MSEVQQGQELDRKDVKIIFYRQSLSELEEKYNDLQANYAIIESQAQQLAQELGRVNEVLKEAGLDTDGKPVEDEKSDEPAVASGDVSKD